MTSKPWTDKTVVIIDDSRRVRGELSETFRAIGMRVVGEAENGAIGLEMVARHRPEVVSLDLIMPEMDGVECYRKMQALHPTVKVVMISWIGGEAKILENLKDLIPEHLFIAKPVSAADLAARLERIYFPHSLAKNSGKIGADPLDDFLGRGLKVS